MHPTTAQPTRLLPRQTRLIHANTGVRLRVVSGRLWLTQRPDTGEWAGLWSLPEWHDAEALAALAAGWQGEGEVLPVIQHVLTHFDWTLRPLRWTLPARVYANEGIAQVLFFESDEVCETSYKDRGGKYQGQRGVTLPKT